MTEQILVGRLNKITPKEGVDKNNRAYRMAKLFIDKGDNTNISISTITYEKIGTPNDVDTANLLNGQIVEVKFTSSGQYNNLVKGGIKLADGNSPVNSTPTTQAPITNYSGINTTQQVSQSNAPVNNTSTNFENNEKRKIRGMCVSYAKDLCVGNNIEFDKIIDVAEEMFKYVWTGVTPKQKAKNDIEKSPGLQPANEYIEDDHLVTEEDVVY